MSNQTIFTTIQATPSDNMFAHIDHGNVVVLNSDHGKPWDERMGEQVYIKSDADDQRSAVGTGASYSYDRSLVECVPFTRSVKPRLLPPKSGPDDQTPAKVALFANVDKFDLEDAD